MLQIFSYKDDNRLIFSVVW